MDVTLASSPTAKRADRFWRVAMRVAVVVAIIALALLVRMRAVALLPADYDEDDYLRAGQFYAQHIAAGDIAGIVNERENYEHPPLTKLVFGMILATTQPAESYATPVQAGKQDTPARPEIARQVQPLRSFSAVLGALTAGVVAVLNPLAGLLVALNSWHIKYTSQAMLEAIPCFFATLTLLLLRHSRRNGDGWSWLAALTLGITAAGTYRYAAGGFAALAWLIWRGYQAQRSQTSSAKPGKMAALLHSLPFVLLWGGLALLTFYAFDPAIWPDPLGRLRDSILFNTGYASGAQVQQAGLPWYQPLAWLIGAVPWNPGVIPLLLDGIFALLGLVVLRRMWRTERLIVLWVLANLIFLFFWPTKWPQYILALTVAISWAAAYWLGDWRRSLATRWHRWRASDKREQRLALFWLLPALLFFAVVVVYPLLLQIALAMSDFQVRNLRPGLGEFWLAIGRGFLALPPSATNPLDYYGMGTLVFLSFWPDFLPILRFNVLWVLVTMLLATALGLWLATLLQRRGLRGRGLWRTLFILPWAIPEFVGALIWNTLFDDTFGGINALTGMQVKWLSDPTPLIDFQALLRPLVTALNSARLNPLGETLGFLAYSLSTPKAFWVMVLVGVWVAFPFMMLVSVAALRSIPPDVYDAARVDGARGWTLWRTITWPLIRPTIWAGFLLRGILLFNAFYIPQMLIGDTRPTDTATLSYIGYIVLSFDSDYSFAALINTVVLGVAIVLIWLFNRQTRVVEGVEYT